MFSPRILLFLLFFTPSLTVLGQVALESDEPPSSELSIRAKDGTDMTVLHYPAAGDTLIIWVGSSYNFSDKIYRTAHRFARKGIEVWQVDFSEVLFQPKSSNFMRNMNAQYVADLIESAHQRTNKKIVLLARAYGAIPTMRGATLWQQQHSDQNYLVGAILFSPDFYKSIPQLGMDPEYLEITTRTTLPTMIYQGGVRSSARQLPRLLSQLRQSNNNIYLKVMPGVNGVFYRGDLEPVTLAVLDRLPDEIPQVIRMLEKAEQRRLPKDYSQPSEVITAQLDVRLKPFKGSVQPRTFTLQDASGRHYQFQGSQDKVMVVNFWATWCPPCVEEIPSLNRLRKKMQGKPFELISVNYAEPKQRIMDFFKQVNVEFPVLLDSDGKVSEDWNVFAFPSTFVIHPNGQIVYGVNAAILWDAPEVIELLNSMMP